MTEAEAKTKSCPLKFALINGTCDGADRADLAVLFREDGRPVRGHAGSKGRSGVSLNVMVRVRKVVNAYRAGRLVVSCEDAFRIAEELLVTRAALKSQVASTILFGKRLGLTDHDLDLGTRQSRAALGEIARGAMSNTEIDDAMADYLERPAWDGQRWPNVEAVLKNEQGGRP